MSKTAARKRKWLNLNDPKGAKLQVGTLDGGAIALILTGIASNDLNMERAIKELSFEPSDIGRTLIKALPKGRNLVPDEFKAIWPNTKTEYMLISEMFFDIQGEINKAALAAVRSEKEESEPSQEQEEAKQEAIENRINTATFLGRNGQNLRVYQDNNVGSRFYVTEDAQGVKSIKAELPTKKESAFLYARANENAPFECAQGLVNSALADDTVAYSSFVDAAFEQTPSDDERELFRLALDAALADALTERHHSPNNAWNDAVKAEAIFSERHALTSDYTIPAPLAIQTQRFLEQTGSLQIVGTAAPSLYATLGDSTQLYANSETLARAASIETRPELNATQKERINDGAIFVINDNEPIESVLNEAAFANINEQGLAVVLTSHAPDDIVASVQGLDNTHIVQFIKAPAPLCGSEKDQYLCLIKRGDTSGYLLRKGVRPVEVASWDNLRLVSDETLTRMGREDLSLFNEDNRAENSFQRPYRAFSQTSPARTMTPKNLQGALGYALTNLEKAFGPIDDFVSEELEIGYESLSKRFVSEQVDAIGLAISSMLNKRGFILGDDTGVGKGRTIAASAMWANKNNKKVIFVTDRSTLFSDFARDLIDIEEWNRFKPLITNADGVVYNIMGEEKEVIAKPLSPAEMQQVMRGQAQSEHNIVFTTYSQMNAPDSEKGAWLLKESEGAILFLDEAHIGAGNKSNIGKHIEEMVDRAEGVVYSSATWAKSHDNLAIYKKALPDSVNMNQVQALMEEEGDSFSEVFSTMLAMDGAFIRREHDTSKITYRNVMDEENYDYNSSVSDQVSQILGQMSLLSGDTNNMIQRINSDTRREMLDGQSARRELLAAINEDIHNAKNSVNEHQETYDNRLERYYEGVTLLSVTQALVDFAKKEGVNTEVLPLDKISDYITELSNQSISDEALDAIDTLTSNILRAHSEDGREVTRQLTELDTQGRTTKALEEIASSLRDQITHLASQGETPTTDTIYALFENNGITNDTPFNKQLMQIVAMDSISSHLSYNHMRVQDLRRIEPQFQEAQYKLNRLNEQAKATNTNTSTGSLFKSSFGTGGAIYNIMRRTIAALSVEHAANTIVNSVEENRRPVVILDETGGSHVKRLIDAELERAKRHIAELQRQDSDGELTPEQRQSREIANLIDRNVKPLDVVREIRVPTIRDLLRNELRRLGGVDIREVSLQTDSESMATKTTSETSVSHFIDEHYEGTEREELVERYAKGIANIEAAIDALPALSISPIDSLRHKLKKAGISLGEVTGRDYQLEIINEPDSEYDDTYARIVKRDHSKKEVTNTIHDFNSGTTDAILMNEAGATGVSVHASPRFLDSRQRELVIIETATNASTDTQLRGRPNRLDQITPPIMTTLSLGLSTERRYTMMENKKTANQTSYTRSSRESATINQDVAVFLNATGDRMCQEYLLEHSGIASRLGIEMSAIERPYGLASQLTQRTAMLGTQLEKRIHAELIDAYEDALTEEKLTYTNRDIPLMDWKAKTVNESHAWGSRVAPEGGGSVFDAPVRQRVVTYESERNPLHWNDVRDLIKANNQKLIKDPRVSVAAPTYISSRPINATPSDQTIAAEKDLTPTQRRAAFARHIAHSLFQGSNATKEREDYTGQVVAASLPMLGTTQQANALLRGSVSGETAELWLLSESKDAENQSAVPLIRGFDIDLVKLKDLAQRTFASRMRDPITDFSDAQIEEMGQIVRAKPKSEPQIAPEQTQWLVDTYHHLMSSNDPEIERLDLSEAFERAERGFESKKIIGLSSVKEADSIEKALESDTHNAVKEAHHRQLFVKNTLSHLSPGATFMVDVESQRRFARFFGGKQFTVVGITLPPAGMESTLGKWKFDLTQAGAEAPITVSGATLKKIAGDNPNESAINVIYNVFDYNRPNQQRSTAAGYAMFERGKKTNAATLLTGNVFQASQWARSSRKGEAIIYSDESGRLHRAIKVMPEALRQGVLRVPERLYGEESIKNLTSQLFNEAPTPQGGVTFGHRRTYAFARNLDAAMRNDDAIQKEPAKQYDAKHLEGAVVFHATGDGEGSSHAIDIRLPSNERAQLRTKFIEALKKHRDEWTDDISPYLALHQHYHHVETIRGGRDEKDRTLRILLPAGSDIASRLARAQILGGFIEAHGAELYSIPAASFAASLLTAELEKHHERAVKPDSTRHAAIVAGVEKRRQRRQVMQDAFGGEQSKAHQNSAIDEQMQQAINEVEKEHLQSTQSDIRPSPEEQAALDDLPSTQLEHRDELEDNQMSLQMDMFRPSA